MQNDSTPNSRKFDQNKDLNILKRSTTPDNDKQNSRNLSINFKIPPKMKEFNNPELDSIQQKLTKIFEYYCQFGERMNVNNLKLQNFHKMLCDAGLIDYKLTKTRVELIYASEHKNKQIMTFDSFLSTLLKISEVKFSDFIDNSKNQNLNNLLANILPLYERLIDKKIETKLNDSTDFLSDSKIYSSNNNEIELDNETQEIIQVSIIVLYEIYRVYFPWELSNSDDNTFLLENSKKGYFNFLKNFNLWPELINKTNANNIFQTEIYANLEITQIYINLIKKIDLTNCKKFNTKNFFGQFFNFFKYLRAITRIAEMCFMSVEASVNRKLKLHGNKLF